MTDSTYCFRNKEIFLFLYRPPSNENEIVIPVNKTKLSVILRLSVHQYVPNGGSMNMAFSHWIMKAFVLSQRDSAFFDVLLARKYFGSLRILSLRSMTSYYSIKHLQKTKNAITF
jgi:hypothetical protein